MQEIYLDNAATTELHPEALKAMLDYLKEDANPSAIYHKALKSKAAIAKARASVAKVINAEPDEIYFTSGGTEADNWVLTGVYEAALEDFAKRGIEGRPHIITDKIEHHAVLETCHYLEKRGAEVTYLDVDGEGHVDPASVEKAIKATTCLVSLMTANNETGHIQDIEAVCRLARKREILCHTDAVQAYGHIPLDVKALPVDFLSASAHKCGGPKGVGCLYIRRGLRLGSFLHGGQQERGRRAGTENTVGIVGFGAASRLALEKIEENRDMLTAKRTYLTERLLKEIPGARLNGGENRLPGHVNMTFPGVDGEALLIFLDMKGIAASAGSACASGSISPSHVLTAMGLSYAEAHGTIRMTLSVDISEEDLNVVVDTIKKGCDNIRRM